jgi:hypothetical protein
MSITDVILVMSAVISTLTAALTFLLFVYTLNIRNQVQQIYQSMSTVLMKLFALEHTTVKLASGFTDFIKLTEEAFDGQSPKGSVLYKTTDGKYSAHTVDELIEKIKKDGAGDDYFDEEELDKLKRLFDNEDDDSDNEEQ